MVNDLDVFTNSKGEDMSIKRVMALCRCGQSNSKPFCDGAHLQSGFTDNKEEGREPNRIDTYVGKKITIHDNRGVCAHRGYCTDNLPTVFLSDTEPWINPDGASPEDIERVINMCPSGALSYTKDGVLFKDLQRYPAIRIAKNESYDVVGGCELVDPDGNNPESKEHYTLCRCGHSKNKPFCDGQHWYVDFKDDKN